MTRFKIIITILICFGFWIANLDAKSQKPPQNLEQASYTKLIPPEKLKEDLDFLFKTIEEVHPNMYAYINKKEFARIRDELYVQSNQSLRSIEFYKLMARAVTHLGTGHCNVFPYGVNEFLERGKLFPLECQWDSSSLTVIIDLTGGDVPVGSKILAINGQEASELIDRLAKYYPSDHKVGNPYKAAATIIYSLWVENGQVDTYKVKAKSHDGPIKNLELQTVTYDQIKSKRGNNAEKSKNKFSYQYLEGISTSILEVHTFDEKLMEEFTEFLNSSFEKICKDKVSNIIIDVRKNKGGITSMSSLLLGYLTDQPFRQFDRYELKISKQLLDPTNNARRRISKRAAENAKIGSMLVQEVPFEELTENPWRFEGCTFVLIGRRTFSTACSFASAIKCFQIGTLVGEEPQETAAKYSDILVFTLPNSGLQFSVPCRYYVVACGKPDGHGIIPDYEVKQKPEDTAKGVDTALQFTLEFIKGSDPVASPK